MNVKAAVIAKDVQTYLWRNEMFVNCDVGYITKRPKALGNRHD